MIEYVNGPLRFDVTDTGAEGRPVVILLHGFPADRACWDKVAPMLVEGGFRTLAPDQRGYSPGARPPRRRDYVVDNLAGDVLALADAAGAERFSVVGHDWGAIVAWWLAAHHPERVDSLAALSVPHPDAFRWSMGHSTQLLHSWYMGFFQLPAIPERMLGSRNGAFFQRSLERDHLDADAARRYGAPGRTLRGPLGWYRALPFAGRRPLGPVAVPTLFIWGEGDSYVTRAAAERCGHEVTGAFQFEALAGESHWLPEAAPARVGELLLAHLVRHSMR